MMDKSLHVLFHCCSWGRGYLVVLNSNGSRRHLIQTLVDYSERLSKLFHSAQIPIIAITIYANGNIELYLTISIIWLTLSDIPRDTGTPKHNASEGVVESICG
jgi:hypothetical protein